MSAYPVHELLFFYPEVSFTLEHTALLSVQRYVTSGIAVMAPVSYWASTSFGLLSRTARIFMAKLGVCIRRSSYVPSVIVYSICIPNLAFGTK